MIPQANAFMEKQDISEKAKNHGKTGVAPGCPVVYLYIGVPPS
jgi:hypothetical protein